MFPIIVFRYSCELQTEILRHDVNERKLSNFTIKLSKKFARHKNTILSNIEKLTGFKWDIDKINVWVFEGLYPSISFPLMVNCYDYDIDMSLFSLVHELVHNIFFFTFYVKDYSQDKIVELEAIVQLVTKGVCKRIFSKSKLDKLCKKAEFDGKYKSVWEGERELEKIWNLEDKPLKEWVKGNNLYVVIL